MELPVVLRPVQSLRGSVGRTRLPDAGQLERLVGRIAIGAVLVIGLLVVEETALPGGHIDVLWIALIAVTLATALAFGPVAGALVTLIAGLAIDVALLEPRGSLFVTSLEDAIALVLFVAVSLIGAFAVARARRRPDSSGLGLLAPILSGQKLIEPLTTRELEILAMLARGQSNHEMAQCLVVSENTIKTHLEHLYRKLDVPSRGRAVAEGRRLGLLVD